MLSTDSQKTFQGAETPANSTHHEPSKKRPICRFYNTKNGGSCFTFTLLFTLQDLFLFNQIVGCRAGDSCRFRHPTPQNQDSSSDTAVKPAPVTSKESEGSVPAMPPKQASSARVVPRPLPKTLMDDPRAFQINQIQRRFKPTVSEQIDRTTLNFDMKPSDPDFPYDIEALECTLAVPKSYPGQGKPSLTIRNKDIPRGFQVNIERGFDRIAASSPSAYLLGLINRLDQQLESILGAQKAETITIVSNRGPASATEPLEPPKSIRPAPVAAQDTVEQPSTWDLEDAKKKRQADVRQLDARFGKMPHYAKSTDGMTYTLPLDSPKRSTWPASLQTIRSFQLKIPERYPLDPLELRLFSDSTEAKSVENAFKERSASDRKATITQQVNFLTSHVKEMAVPAEPVQQESVRAPPAPLPAPAPSSTSNDGTGAGHKKLPATEFDDSHIKHIPRPPEWDTLGSGDDSSSDSYESDEDSDDQGEEPAPESQESQPTSSAAPAERGILLSFPRLELHGIELLELTSLNLSVKCERCKEISDIEKLRSSPENSKMREISCKKCATTLAARFRADMIHANSVRAGYLDLDACTVVDMLPSNFSPTCSQCSTQYPAPGIVAVRGDNSLAICRECHAKMFVKILEAKFLLVSASAGKHAFRPYAAPLQHEARS